VAVRAVVFDIGGVLEVTPFLGVNEMWDARLGLASGEVERRLRGVLAAGSVGAVTIAEVHQRIGELLRLGPAQVAAFMADAWAEYLGTLNPELADYFTSLRLAYQTAIISNSFIGAMELEQERYGFEQMTDLIIYSHEAGVAKPDPRISSWPANGLMCTRRR
jgi:FMN phosphatase YigB (HAD superfamily)